jgi:RNase H-fold protein (predicted Holliday junction resolvase)
MVQADYPAPEIALRAQKLAELIVEECVEQIITGVRTNPPQAEPPELVRTLVRRIQQHFGVEE